MKYYVLEWNALDDRIELYPFSSRSKDIAVGYEEASEELHNYSSILLMDNKKLRNLINAIDSIKNNLEPRKSARAKQQKTA